MVIVLFVCGTISYYTVKLVEFDKPFAHTQHRVHIFSFMWPPSNHDHLLNVLHKNSLDSIPQIRTQALMWSIIATIFVHVVYLIMIIFLLCCTFVGFVPSEKNLTLKQSLNSLFWTHTLVIDILDSLIVWNARQIHIQCICFSKWYFLIYCYVFMTLEWSWEV